MNDVDIHKTMAGGKWTFNASVTDVFEEMLERSIPQYQVMRELVAEVGKALAVRGFDIVDLGASRGDAVMPLLREFGALNHYVLVECAEAMVGVLKERFKDYISSGVVNVVDRDMRFGLPHFKATLVQSILTLMFTPINYRQQIIRDIYDGLIPGGALILVEKVLGDGEQVDALMVARYHALKGKNGYSQEEITRKALALEGVQVPLTASFNEALLHRAGFRQVDTFWAWMNFRGWLAIK